MSWMIWKLWLIIILIGSLRLVFLSIEMMNPWPSSQYDWRREREQAKRDQEKRDREDFERVLEDHHRSSRPATLAEKLVRKLRGNP